MIGAFIAGLFTGGIVGLAVACICFVSGRASKKEEMEEYRKKVEDYDSSSSGR